MPQEDPGRWSVRELRSFLAARNDATCAHATEKRELADRVRVLQRERAAPRAPAPAAAPPPTAPPEVAEAIARVLAAADAYEALGVESGASRAACKKAYRRLALKLHPDKCQLSNAEEGQCRLCAAAATVPHIVAMAAWTCWVATFLCSHCSMSIIPLLWLMSAGATFVAACVTGWLVCKHPAEDEPLPTHVSVTIPPDCEPGQTLSVACPQLPPGRQMVTFVVPPGAEAGATIQIPVGGPPVVSAAKDTA